MAPYDKDAKVSAEHVEKVEPRKEPEAVRPPELSHPYDMEAMRAFGCTYAEAVRKGLVHCDCGVGRASMIVPTPPPIPRDPHGGY